MMRRERRRKRQNPTPNISRVPPDDGLCSSRRLLLFFACSLLTLACKPTPAPVPTSLKVDIAGISGATGTVTITSSDGKIDCPARCGPAGYSIGATVTVTAHPALGAEVVGWSLPCTGSGNDCTFKPAGAQRLNVTFGPPHLNRLFITSSNYTGSQIGGLSGADALCNAHARAAKLPGQFSAFLSTASVNAVDRFAGKSGWIRADGRPVTDTLAATVSPAPQMFYFAAADEWGHLSSGSSLGSYWTGSSLSGKYVSGKTCGDWTQDDSEGLAGNVDIQTWVGYASASCSTPLPLLCLGTDFTSQLPLTPNPVAGRTAFVSQNSFDPGTGLLGADALCAQEAKTSGLSGTFLALLSTPSAGAAARFDALGSPWVRPDGVAVVEEAADLFTGKQWLLAPLSLNADKTYKSELEVITGGGGPGNSLGGPTNLGTISGTCNNWTGKSESTATNGIVGSPDKWFEVNTNSSCAPGLGSARIYCLEQ